jgi:hypothetical protein
LQLSAPPRAYRYHLAFGFPRWLQRSRNLD